MTGLDKMSVSRALVRPGPARAAGEEARPGRQAAHLLWLSAAGQRVYEKIGVSGKARETQLFAAVGPAEQAQLARTLDTLIDTLLKVDAPVAGPRSRGA